MAGFLVLQKTTEERKTTMRGRLLLSIILALAFVAPIWGDEPPAELRELAYSVRALDESAAAGVITEAQAKQGIDRYLVKAKQIAGRDVTLTELTTTLAAAPSPAPTVRLTRLQKFAGFITFVNIAWLIAIIIGVISLLYLLRDLITWLVKRFLDIPIEVYEVVSYLGSIGLIVLAKTLGDGTAPYVALTGCLLFGGALTFTAMRRKWRSVDGISLILFIAWGITAMVFTSSLVGFFAIIALMTALGFSGAVIPMGYMIGFKDEDSLGRATSASLIILTGFVFLRVFGNSIPYLSVFESGALFMGSFVGFLGLLIASSRYYRDGDGYVTQQLITIIAGVLALFVGSTWSIPELQKIGGTFFALYAVEKFTDIPMKQARTYATVGLILSSLIYGFCMMVKQNPDAWRPYLLF